MENQKIPFLDLKRQYLQIRTEVLEATEKVFENTAFTNGYSVQEFEKSFSLYTGAAHTIAVNNGTSALQLAMHALDIKEGDEVILPANTFIATAWAPAYYKAIPVFTDCDPDTWQIDPAEVEKKITSKTKAIIGVHLYGQPCDMDALRTIAMKHGLAFIEDAAQAQGSLYKGKMAGSFGDMACFSFYPGKNLGAYGEGGAITTSIDAYASRLQKLRNHSSVDKYYHEEIGYNMRMGGVEGAVLGIKLKYLDGWNNRRREIARMYTEGIDNTAIKMQKQAAGTSSNFHLFVITTEHRDHLMKYLNENLIYPGLHYPVPCHLQKAFSYLGYIKGDCPNSEYLAAHCLSLPMFPELTDQEAKQVIDTINKYTGI